MTKFFISNVNKGLGEMCCQKGDSVGKRLRFLQISQVFLDAVWLLPLTYLLWNYAFSQEAKGGGIGHLCTRTRRWKAECPSGGDTLGPRVTGIVDPTIPSFLLYFPGFFFAVFYFFEWSRGRC